MRKLTRYAVRLGAAAVILAAALGGQTANAGKKVSICHIPPGNPDNAHTILVSASAVPAHEAHGDTMGECPGPGTGTGSGSSGGGSGSGAFSIVLCDNREGETGRTILVSGSGRATVTDAECQ